MANKYSNHKICWHQDKLESIRCGNITAPIYVRIKPTNRCNMSCGFCVYGSQRNKAGAMHSVMHQNVNHSEEIPIRELLKLIDDLADNGVKCITFSGGGEPLLYLNIVEAMNRVKERGMKLSIITNGVLMSVERAESLFDASWVRVSMDYATSEEFIKSRRMNDKAFKTVIENLKDFKSKSKGCELTVNWIVTKENWREIPIAVNLLSFVDNIRFSPVWVDRPFYHAPFYHEAKNLIQEAKLSIRSKIYDGYNIDPDATKRKVDRCHFWQICPVVGADGNIYACHNKAYDSNACIGSIYDGGFFNSWNKSMSKMDSFNPKDRCRCQCANESKNILINNIIEAYGDDFV